MNYLSRFLGWFLWRLSHHERAHGFDLAWAVDSAALPLARARLREGLDLLDETWPRWASRARQYVRRIQVVSVLDASAQWHQHRAQIELNQEYLCSPTTSAADIAGLLVHEATHARIDAARIPYLPRMRVRIERACISEQIRFALALESPDDSARLATHYRENWRSAEAIWSPEQADHHATAALSRAGMPQWIIRAGLRIRRRRGSQGPSDMNGRGDR